MEPVPVRMAGDLPHAVGPNGSPWLFQRPQQQQPYREELLLISGALLLLEKEATAERIAPLSVTDFLDGPLCYCMLVLLVLLQSVPAVALWAPVCAEGEGHQGLQLTPAECLLGQ